jgi:hypothetical protein
VQIYRVPASDGDPVARVTVDSAGGSKSKTISFAAGNEGWVDLGSYPFSVGSAGSVTSAASGHGCIHTSMVKFVRE